MLTHTTHIYCIPIYIHVFSLTPPVLCFERLFLSFQPQPNNPRTPRGAEARCGGVDTEGRRGSTRAGDKPEAEGAKWMWASSVCVRVDSVCVWMTTLLWFNQDKAEVRGREKENVTRFPQWLWSKICNFTVQCACSIFNVWVSTRPQAGTKNYVIFFLDKVTAIEKCNPK